MQALSTWSRVGLPAASIFAFGLLSPGLAPAQTLSSSGYNPSLTSDTSYFLFRSDFDQLQNPARLAPLDVHSLYTMLSNQGQGTGYSIGLGTPLASGGLGIFLSTNGTRSETSLSDQNLDPDTGASVDQTDQVAWSQARSFSLYAGYGQPLGALYAGLGTRINLYSSRASTDSSLRYGGFNSTYEDFDANTTQTVTGEYRTQNDSYQVVLSGLSGNPDATLILAELYLRGEIDRSLLTMDQDQEGFTRSVEGISSTNPFANANSFSLGATANPELQLTNDLRLEAMLSAEMSLFSVGEAAFQDTTLVTGSSASQKTTTDVEVEAQALNRLELIAWTAGQFRINPMVELRMGVGYQHSRLYSDANTRATLTSITTVGDQSSTTVYEQVDNALSVSNGGRLMAPCAVRLRASDKLGLVLGAQYRMDISISRSETHEVSEALDGEAQPVNAGVSSSTYFQSTPSMYYAAGLEVNPTPRISLDFSLTRVPTNAARYAYTSNGFSFYGAATVHW